MKSGSSKSTQDQGIETQSQYDPSKAARLAEQDRLRKGDQQSPFGSNLGGSQSADTTTTEAPSSATIG